MSVKFSFHWVVLHLANFPFMGSVHILLIFFTLVQSASRQFSLHWFDPHLPIVPSHLQIPSTDHFSSLHTDEINNHYLMLKSSVRQVEGKWQLLETEGSWITPGHILILSFQAPPAQLLLHRHHTDECRHLRCRMAGGWMSGTERGRWVLSLACCTWSSLPVIKSNRYRYINQQVQSNNTEEKKGGGGRGKALFRRPTFKMGALFLLKILIRDIHHNNSVQEDCNANFLGVF